MMPRTARLYCLTSLLVFTNVPSTYQVPIRAKQEDPRLLTVEDPMKSPDVTVATPDPLENEGVELSQGYLIEGDIRVWHRFPLQESKNIRTNSQESGRIGPGSNSHQTRNSVSAEETWVERVIPYEIDPNFNSTERQIILDAMNEIMMAVNNCTVFAEREKQEDFLYITGQENGCYSDGVGKVGGNQTVSISRASECISKGIIMHELMHALGFWHEHNRPDREKYIEVLLYNVRIDHTKDFNINKNGKMLVDYDYYSIMHYKTRQFSKNPLSLDTIRILQPGIDETQVGQRSYLSEKDKERIFLLYECRKFLRSASNSTRNTEYLGDQGISNSSTPLSLDIKNMQETSETSQNKDVHAENLAAGSTQGNNDNLVSASKSNITETAEVGRK